MQNNFFRSYLGNIYLRPSTESKVASQILYGEKFKIISKKKNWFKIKTEFDNYIGFIKKDKFNKKFKPIKKIYKLKSRIFAKKKSKFFPTNKFLFFGTGVAVIKENKKFIEFEKNRWIRSSNINLLNYKIKNYSKITKLFLNTKYKWGGKTFDGIDCSSLIQLFYKYNNKFFPRDTVDQIKCKKGKRLKNNYKAGDLIYWRGHVALCLNSKILIHAYGPKKKVLIMPIYKTIKLIEKTANLKVLKVFSI